MLIGHNGFIVSWILIMQFESSIFADRIHNNTVEEPLACYTCVDVSSNYICNRYAIDIPCKKGNDYCYTEHIMDSKGDSVIVNKKCANSTECWPSAVGCLTIDKQTICIACCDEIFCNITVPTNHSEAVLSISRLSHKRNKTFTASGCLRLSSTHLLLIPSILMSMYN